MIAVALPEQLPLPKDAVTFWVIYDHPRDFREGFVLRAQFAMRTGDAQVSPEAWYADDPDKLRAIIPPGLTRLMRCAGDDPVIMETWL
jgi:hypothetical protein